MIDKQLRRAIKRSPMSMNELGNRADVPIPTISRFMAEERSMTLPSAARLCKVLGLKLTAD